MAASTARFAAVVMVLMALAAGCAARPMAAEPQQARQLARAASSLQLQLSAVQDRLSAFATALTSSGTTPLTAARHQNLRSKGPAASPPTAASPAPTAPEQTTAEGFAAAKAAIASKLRDHTYNPAALKGEHTTMLLKPDGKVFTRSWTWDGPTANVDLPAAAAALQPQSGEAYASLPSRGAGCDGCIGADTRARVSDAAAAAFPQTAIGQLTATAPATPGSAVLADEWCTGAMISPRHVLTAAHCVFDVQGAHAPMTDVAFAPGRNGAATPFSTIAFESVRLLDQFQSQTSYTDTAANNDFAVITLAQPVGRRTGWLGLAYSSTAQETVDLTTIGFPDDKPQYTMWDTTCARTSFQNAADPANNIVQHNCDSTHGQSGSPMFDASRNVRAVLTGGNSGGINWAVKVDEFVFSTVLGWMQEDGEFAGVGAAAGAGSPPVMELADVSGAAAATAASGR